MYKLIFLFIIINLSNISFASNLTDYIIKKVIETDNRNTDFQAEVSIYSKGYYEKGIKKDTLKESKIKGIINFKRPKNVIFKVQESDDYMARGSTLFYSGGEKVQIRASGILGFFKVSFNINDPIFSNARNHKFSFDGLKSLKYGFEKSDISLENIGGKKYYILKAIPKLKADNEITGEVYYIDADTFIVNSIEMYSNNDLVSKYSIKNIVKNK